MSVIEWPRGSLLFTVKTCPSGTRNNLTVGEWGNKIIKKNVDSGMRESGKHGLRNINRIRWLNNKTKKVPRLSYSPVKNTHCCLHHIGDRKQIKIIIRWPNNVVIVALVTITRQRICGQNTRTRDRWKSVCSHQRCRGYTNLRFKNLFFISQFCCAKRVRFISYKVRNSYYDEYDNIE